MPRKRYQLKKAHEDATSVSFALGDGRVVELNAEEISGGIVVEAGSWEDTALSSHDAFRQGVREEEPAKAKAPQSKEENK